MYTKTLEIKVKAGPEDGLPDGTFIAYAAVFNNVDSVGDRILPGAFTTTLAEWQKAGISVPVLWGHRMDDPDFNIGHVTVAEEDNAGLKVTCQLDLSNPKSLSTYKLLKGRRVDQMSFAYDETDSGPAVYDGKDVWEIRSCKLYEVSVVTVGANQETEILAVKGLSHFADRALRDMKAGRVLSAKNEGELREAHEAIGRVLAALSTVEDVGKTASGDDPSRHAPPPPGDQASRGASRKPSVDAAERLRLSYEMSA